MLQQFKEHLEGQGMSANTVAAYAYAVEEYESQHQELTKTSLTLHKNYLTEHYSPRTVNLRLQALNRYLRFCGKEEWHLKSVKVQQRPYLENVISEADYEYLKTCLLRDDNRDWYFVVRFLAATGARVSELLQIKAEHVSLGYIDLYGKGGKVRRIYIPHKLQTEAAEWLTARGQTSGYLFLNREGGRITARGIAQQLKNIAVRYGIDTKVVYPHSFRHRFAKNFIDRCNDIALLADLMGHESIETTRIYLRRTASEQRQVVDEVVFW
ncbi:MAG: tyrosine-type recombinase/integrase [Bacteroidales bacterium]|nr:tyrosine-type recombinase/integrase [Bacteroidales bacterium]